MKNFIVFIVVIIGVCLLSYYGAWDALILTGDWAWFGLLCIIYFVGDMLVVLGKWIDEPFKVKRDIEKELNNTDIADTDWQQVRIQAAMYAMQGMLANPQTFEQIEHDERYKEIRGGDKVQLVAMASVMYADALVAELQKKGGQDENN